MSYGSPALESAVDELLAQDVDHIVVLPLYPQYSCSTVAAVWDELARILAKKRAIPVSPLFVIMPMMPAISMRWPPAFAHRLPCTANRMCCCFLITAYRSALPTKAMITRSAAAIPPASWSPRWDFRRIAMMTFQSRFGREPWLTPYTDETLKMLGEKG
jgi:ferrochelatase